MPLCPFTAMPDQIIQAQEREIAEMGDLIAALERDPIPPMRPTCRRAARSQTSQPRGSSDDAAARAATPRER